MNLYYNIYGLNVESEIDFREAIQIPKPERIDVTIEYGDMPSYILDNINNVGPTGISKNDNYAWFTNENVGNIVAINGKRIIVSPDPISHEDALIRSIVLGPVLVHTLLQREVPALHAGAVLFQNKAILVCGSSGAGKSTMTMGLMKVSRGFIADDTVVFKINGNQVYAVPGYPQQKICEDIAVAHDLDTNELVRLYEESIKYAVNRKSVFVDEPIKIAVICYITIGDGDELIIREVTGSEKLIIIINNLYLLASYHAIGFSPKVMQDLVTIANNTRIINMIRPKNKNTLQQQVEFFVQNQEAFGL